MNLRVTTPTSAYATEEIQLRNIADNTRTGRPVRQGYDRQTDQARRIAEKSRRHAFRRGGFRR